jgi:AbrB family looped-hinge helix DNA binding protein
MQKIRVKVRKKGQVTLPQQIRNKWKIEEGTEIDIIPSEDQAIIRPIKNTKVQEEAGSLGASRQRRG